MQPVADVRASSFMISSFFNLKLKFESPKSIISKKIRWKWLLCVSCHCSWSVSVFLFFLVPPVCLLASLTSPSTRSVSPYVFTHHSVTLSLSLSLSHCWLCPSLCSSTHFFHGFFGCLFPLSSLLLLLLKPRDAAHLTAAAVSRACLSLSLRCRHHSS